MATLIAVYNSEGCVGRCDAKCYGAKHPACDCICGGRNHGVGRQKAEQNVREFLEAEIQQRLGPDQAAEFLTALEVRQDAAARQQLSLWKDELDLTPAI